MERRLTAAMRSVAPAMRTSSPRDSGTELAPVAGSAPIGTVAVTGSPTAVVVVASPVVEEVAVEGAGAADVGVTVVIGAAVGVVVGSSVVGSSVVAGAAVVVGAATTGTVVVTTGVRISPVETTRALHCTVSVAWPVSGAVVTQSNDGVD
jgi:hypothetical protein